MNETLPAAQNRTVAIINLDHLRHNLRIVRRAAGRTDLMAVVKADAYGHGATRVARTLAGEGVSHFAVATVPEAIELRSAGISEHILVFGPPQPDELSIYERFALDVSVTSGAVAESIVHEAKGGRSFRVHAKVDTGMHRLGLGLHEASACINALLRTPRIDVAAVWTHFASAGEPHDIFALDQVDRLKQVLHALDGLPRSVHAASSAALFSLPASLSFDLPVMARPGIALYGLLENEEDIARHGLRPVMTLRSRIVHIQDLEQGETVSYGRTWTAPRRTRIATVSAGYADGYHRSLSNRSHVAFPSGRVPVIGRVCMDLFMVDLGPPGRGGREVAIGDEAVLFGERGPSATEVAQWMDSIPHEICSSVSQRVPRAYVDTLAATGGAQDPAQPNFV